MLKLFLRGVLVLFHIVYINQLMTEYGIRINDEFFCVFFKKLYEKYLNVSHTRDPALPRPDWVISLSTSVI